jgi:hypothetical protein
MAWLRQKNLFSYFCVMAETNEMLQPGMWNLVWKRVVNVSADVVWNIFIVKITNMAMEPGVSVSRLFPMRDATSYTLVSSFFIWSSNEMVNQII